MRASISKPTPLIHISGLWKHEPIHILDRLKCWPIHILPFVFFLFFILFYYYYFFFCTYLLLVVRQISQSIHWIPREEETASKNLSEKYVHIPGCQKSGPFHIPLDPIQLLLGPRYTSQEKSGQSYTLCWIFLAALKKGAIRHGHPYYAIYRKLPSPASHPLPPRDLHRQNFMHNPDVSGANSLLSRSIWLQPYPAAPDHFPHTRRYLGKSSGYKWQMLLIRNSSGPRPSLSQTFTSRRPQKSVTCFSHKYSIYLSEL